jgi:ferric-dicitrate binding protein FerR (iron transport regulator)
LIRETLMNENRKRLNFDEELIREVLREIEPPVERERLKQAFLRSANDHCPASTRWAGILFPRLAMAGVVFYLAGAWIYLWMTFSSSAIQSVQGSHANEWRSLYQAALGKAVPYRQGDELRLADGSRVRFQKDAVLSVVFTLKERLLNLRQGSIEISAASNANLPMIVSSGEANVRVTGTKFIVSTDEPSWNKEQRK